MAPYQARMPVLDLIAMASDTLESFAREGVRQLVADALWVEVLARMKTL